MTRKNILFGNFRKLRAVVPIDMFCGIDIDLASLASVLAGLVVTDFINDEQQVDLNIEVGS